MNPDFSRARIVNHHAKGPKPPFLYRFRRWLARLIWGRN
jgi:hypothetical protein